MKIIIQILQVFVPNAVVRIAYYFMSNPRIKKLRESEKNVLDESIKTNIDYRHFRIRKYEWGKDNAKKALLVHGWEGRAGNFAFIINILVRKGYNVIAFDAPSHGESTKGKTNMFEFADFIKAQFSNINPILVVSHSFGSVNTGITLRKNPNLKTDLWIMVTVPYKFIAKVNDMAKKFGLNRKTKEKLILLVQRDTQGDINNLDMSIYCNELTNVKRAIIVHSKTDKVLPISGAREVAKSFKQCELIELENTGHYSILWSDELGNIIDENA